MSLSCNDEYPERVVMMTVLRDGNQVMVVNAAVERKRNKETAAMLMATLRRSNNIEIEREKSAASTATL